MEGGGCLADLRVAKVCCGIMGLLLFDSRLTCWVLHGSGSVQLPAGCMAAETLYKCS